MYFKAHICSAHSVCMHVFSIYVGTYLKYIHYAHYASKYTYTYVCKFVIEQDECTYAFVRVRVCVCV